MRDRRETCSQCEQDCVPYFTVEPGDYYAKDGKAVLAVWGYFLCHQCWLSSQNCLDCGWNTRALNEYYRVHDEVWLSVVPDGNGMLCIHCLENRLGRFLTREDFSLDTPINADSVHWPKSIVLRKRMGYSVPPEPRRGNIQS